MQIIKKDIENKEDIKKLVDTFYNKVVKDDTIGFVFNDVAKVNWEEHLPLMYTFWDTMILGKTDYKGNPMNVHIALSRKEELKPEYFDCWIELWHGTIDSLFEGENANRAKRRAKGMREKMLMRIAQDRG